MNKEQALQLLKEWAERLEKEIKMQGSAEVSSYDLSLLLSLIIAALEDK